MNATIKKRDGSDTFSASTDKALDFLYHSVPGRVCLKLANRRIAAKIVGAYMNSPLSRGKIKKFITQNDIDMSRYEETEYRSYNRFFTRKMKPEYLDICGDRSALVAPCDSKLTVYDIDEHTVFFIKGAPYNVTELLKNQELAEEFKGGKCLVFRLTVDNYHRYCYFDDGTKGENIFIKGLLHTVNPISLEEYNYYKQNCREYTVMQTEHFGKAVQCEVGAMFIGKIVNHHGACEYKRGEEKGLFEFGGSTIVLLLGKGASVIDDDITENSKEGIETVVHIGERIGSSVL